jgi:anaerobic magnesium-protoporphyrin IX monomethyl ester cyclase
LEAIEFEPEIVAVSLMFSSSFAFFQKYISVLMSVFNKAQIIVGGVHATNCTKYLLENFDIDLVVRGEGELPLADIILNTSPIGHIHIHGVYSKYNISDTSSLGLATFIDDLDAVPFTDWDLIDMDAYTKARGVRRCFVDAEEKRMATFITTRGCPYKCTYCSAHTVHGRKVRYRSIGNVIKEVSLLNNVHDVTLYIPEDDYFTANHARVVELLDRMHSMGIRGLEIQFPNGLHINTISESIIDALYNCGVKFLNFAIESGSTYTQKNIIKKM